MKFAMLNEGAARHTADRAAIYREVIETIDAAEAAGFDVFGCSEQHFWPDLPGLPSIATISSPEIFYAVASQRTEKMQLRTAITSLPYHHPLLVAEQVATLDIVSGGRMQFGSGRGNSLFTADAFGVPMSETEGRWEESLRLIVAAWESEGDFGWDGHFYQVPPQPFLIKPVQKPHPPLFYAALSPRSHELAGHLGLGLLTGTAGITLEKAAERIELYRTAMKDAEPIGQAKNEFVSLTVLGSCHEDRAVARAQSEEAFIDYYKAATAVYSQTVHRTAAEVDFSKIGGLYTFEDMSETMMIISGTPDDWADKIAQLRDAGVDEVSINFAGIEHEAILHSIELLGREVFPRFR